MIRVADYMAEFLLEQGVKNVFMLSGTGSIHLDDAFAHQEGMRYVCARHEAAAAIMAEASAKLTGNVGVVIATTGPGGTNAMGGVVEAWVDSVPILVISGQVSQKQISEGVRSFGIQGFNIIENVLNITKYAVQVTNPQKIRYHLKKAIHMSREGRPGPVWLDIPFDVQSVLISPDRLEDFIPSTENYFTESDKDKVKEIFNVLLNSKKPLVVFGQGIRSAGVISELKKMLEYLKIPSIAARMGLDILPFSNSYFFGLGGMRGDRVAAKIMKECDLVLALGTSFTHAFSGENYDEFLPTSKLIMVNIDRTELNKPGLKVDIKLSIDLNEFFNIFIKEIEKHNFDYDYNGWLGKCTEYKQKLTEVLPPDPGNLINSYYLIQCLNKSSKKNQIFVNDAGSANYVCSQGLRLRDGQRELTSGAFYSMGVALPLAIGASVTVPTAQVVAVTGDGSIELNIQELRTMSLNNLNIKLFIINNGGYASIRKSQDDMTGGRYTDDNIVLNFSKVADAFELPFFIIEDYIKMEDMVSKIIAVDGPALIEVICDPNQKIVEAF